MYPSVHGKEGGYGMNDQIAGPPCEEQPSRTKVTPGTVRKIFERFGDKGRMVLGGGMAARLLIAESGGMKEDEIRGKDVDLYISRGKPFGKPYAPHEHVQLSLRGEDDCTPVEAIYSPTSYFGFMRLPHREMSEVRCGSLTVPCISPDFYIAAILASVPYKPEKLELVDRLLRTGRCRPGNIANLLYGSAFAKLFEKEIRDPSDLFSRTSDFSQPGFLEDLTERITGELERKLPFILLLDLDLKSQYYALLFDPESMKLMTEVYDQAFSDHTQLRIPGVTLRRKAVFMHFFFIHEYYDQTPLKDIDRFNEMPSDSGMRDLISRFMFAAFEYAASDELAFESAMHVLSKNKSENKILFNFRSVWEGIRLKRISIEDMAYFLQILKHVERNRWNHTAHARGWERKCAMDANAARLSYALFAGILFESCPPFPILATALEDLNKTGLFSYGRNIGLDRIAGYLFQTGFENLERAHAITRKGGRCYNE